MAIVNDLDVKEIELNQLSSEYFMHSSAWAEVKKQTGWQSYAFKQEAFPDLESHFLIQIHKIPVLGFFAYVADGLLPARDWFFSHKPTEDVFQENAVEKKVRNSIQDATRVLVVAYDILRRRYESKIFSMRWDLPWILEKKLGETKEFSAQEFYTKLGLTPDFLLQKYTATYRDCTQAPASVLLRLAERVEQNELKEHSLEDMLASFKQKTRYNIRIAQKHGVFVRAYVSMQDFYDLLQETSKRNSIETHSLAYFLELQRIISTRENMDLVIYGAYFEEKLIACIVVLFSDIGSCKKAVYMYGASEAHYRQYMPAYLLQWQAMSDALEKGCQSYDLFGMAVYADPEDRMFGLYKFKTGFANTIMVRPCAVELGPKSISLRIRRTLFVLSDKVRRWYFLILKKKLARMKKRKKVKS